jgi:hypothetical protein
LWSELRQVWLTAVATFFPSISPASSQRTRHVLKAARWDDGAAT